MDPNQDPAAAPAPAPAASVVDPAPAAPAAAPAPSTDPAPAPAPAPAAAAPAPVAAATVPDKYELKLPSGYTDATVIGRVEEFAKANKLTQEQAQAHLDKTVGELLSYREKVSSDIQRTVEGWQTATKADKEIGGESLVRSLELSKKVITRFGSPELVDYLDKTKLGDNPEFIRIFKRIGEAMKEDDFIQPGSEQGNKKTGADKFYDHPSSQHT